MLEPVKAVVPWSPELRIVHGLLAPWRVRRLRLHIAENLGQRLDTVELASLVKLSPSHFCRVFKQTFGVTVHTYVMNQRLEAAQWMMLNTSEALSSIAVSCGMSDQAHLTRWFVRVFGETPAAWRRARQKLRA